MTARQRRRSDPMSTGAQHGEQQPPTAAVGDRDETAVRPCADETEIVPTLADAGLELAWSHDENDNAAGTSWGAAAERASIIVLGAAAVAVVIGLATWLAFYLMDQNRPMRPPDVKTPTAIAPGPTAAAPPPSTVTVTAPPPTVPVASPPSPRHNDGGAPPPARGTDVFSICPDGHEGVVGGHTSCAFAASVRQSFYASGMPTTVFAYSPVTGDAYEMTCVGRYPAYFSDGSTKISTRCYGGDNAEVVIW